MDINEVLLKYERMMVVIINQIGVSNYDLREDLIQELRIHLVKIYNSGLLNGDIKNISDYIFIILKRKAIDLIIKENKYNNKSLNWMHFNSNKEKLIDQFANENSGIDKQNIIEDIISYISVVNRQVKVSHLDNKSSFNFEPPSYFVKLPCVCVTHHSYLV
jgi:hypothetical protein